MKHHHTNLPELIKIHKELRKYAPKLVELCELKNKLIFDVENIVGTKEIKFSILMLCRNQDFFEGILFSLWHNNVHAVFPLMRALLDDLFLLKYVDKNPEYITQFMDMKKEVDRKKRSIFLRQQSDDKVLKGYFKWLSDRTHPNPVSLKYHLYDVKSTNGEIESAILIRPTCDESYAQAIEALIRIYSEELAIIRRIYLRNIKRKK